MSKTIIKLSGKSEITGRKLSNNKKMTKNSDSQQEISESDDEDSDLEMTEHTYN